MRRLHDGRKQTPPPAFSSPKDRRIEEDDPMDDDPTAGPWKVAGKPPKSRTSRPAPARATQRKGWWYQNGVMMNGLGETRAPSQLEEALQRQMLAHGTGPKRPQQHGRLWTVAQQRLKGPSQPAVVQTKAQTAETGQEKQDPIGNKRNLSNGSDKQ